MTAAGPIVVELRRGPLPESIHVAHAVVVDTAGAVVRSWGDPERLVHPRSSVKPVQALPLVETGAADAFELSDEELALACSSHSGEAGHVAAVDAWLARIGCSHEDLECGVEAGTGPTASGNNCSGKHAGFLTVARHLGVDPRGYIRPDHPVQQLATTALDDATAETLDPARSGIDGCGIPIHPVPLRALGLAAARFGSPDDDWPADRAAAARRLTSAMTAHPWLVAGTDRLPTDLLRAGSGRIVSKDGAEGVQVVALPALGLGIALKVVDGHGPSSAVALGHVLAGVEGQERPEVFGSRGRIRNHAGTHVADLVVAAGPGDDQR